MGERIVLGLGDNIDYEIRWDSGIFERLIRDYALRNDALTVKGDIKTERDLLVSILGFLKESGGGERFVGTSELIEPFSRHFDKKITLGGTAVRAAIAMGKLGYRSALHLVTINEDVKRLIPPDCSWICSNEAPSSYPHLIVQFCAGTRIDANDIHIETSRANRIIYTNDPDNELMKLHPDLAALLEDAGVFLVSGFNSMHNPALVEDRVRKIREILKKLPADTTVFLEDGCYHYPEMGNIVKKYLLDDIDIYSLNEDELTDYCGRNIILTDPEDVSKALEDLRTMLPGPLLVVHTRFWALAYGTHAAVYRGALLGGVTMATARFRFGDDITPDNYAETGRLAPEEGGALFAREIQSILGDRVCCIPSFKVMERDVTTIGLGDAFVGGFLPALTSQCSPAGGRINLSTA
jgi:ADP-dependent phosphofructokinase/glucokinase